MIQLPSHLFTTSASKLDFEGFMSVYVEADDEEEKNQVLGNLEKGRYNPSLVLAWNIAKVFDVTIEEIFTVETD